MKKQAYILVIFILLMELFISQAMSADSQQNREQQIKAAFLYNFIKFIDWPEEKMADSNEPIIIGIIGSEVFINAFEPVKHKKIKDRSISVKYLASFEKLDKSEKADEPQWIQKIKTLKTCHVLLICTCDSARIGNSTKIIKTLKDSPVLTVGETDDFLESGGMINFLIEDKKVRFEINNTAAKQAKLKISSKLLRLARRVIKEKPSGDTKR
ncbi:MAG: YfiR family protein [Planctomycetes bacterium]|nr:YfiR family protein [Planctomycetota bacterium]